MTAPTKRLDALLMSLVQKHVPSGPQRPESGAARVASLALLLAKNGVLVLPLIVPASQQARQSEHVNELVSLYGSFYRLLTDTLFPSLKTISANYADADTPPILVFEAHGLPVIAAFANYLVPFIVANQQQPAVNLAEVQGILNFMLEDMEGQSLAPALQRDLLKRGAEYIMRLLAVPIQQQSLTPFARAAFMHLAPQPPESPLTEVPAPARVAPSPPETPAPARVAPSPPETPKARPDTPFVSAIPIIFDVRDPQDRPRPAPPVLPPPS